MYASVQVREMLLKTRFVLIPCDAIDAGRRSPFQLVERPAQQVDGDMVQQCREPNTSVPSCSLTYAVQRGGYAFPALCLARAAPDRIALGPAPSLDHLRGRTRGLVRQLRRCRVGRGGAYALPLPARSNGSCSFPASRFPMWTPLWRRGRIDSGREIDQPHKSELLHQT